MIRANSLLYAIYICLIVAVMCGAMLYFATLYTQLNLHYNLQEELYLEQQSAVNFALGNKLQQQEIPASESKEGLYAGYATKQHGLLTVLTAEASIQNDTVSSAYFVGAYARDKKAVFLTYSPRPLIYVGKVSITGNMELPSEYIKPGALFNMPMALKTVGAITISADKLPELNPAFKAIYENRPDVPVKLREIEKVKDSMYYNSFLKPTVVIDWPGIIIDDLIMKGNFIIRGSDSLYVTRNTQLEDVLLIAPKITFAEGFKGTVQAFGTQLITLEEGTTLEYPSVVCILNESAEPAKIMIHKGCSVTGAVVLFGSKMEHIVKNTIEIAEGGRITGTLYSTGRVAAKSKIIGTVYTNLFSARNKDIFYDNVIMDLEINAVKRPPYFVSIPLFSTTNTKYGIIKKIL